MMQTELHDFITEIQVSPQFTAAAATDPVWREHLDNIERAFEFIFSEGQFNFDAIELGDQIRAVVTAKQPMKPRLLSVLDLLMAARHRFR